MKGVTDNECVAAMIGDVKVAVAGLSQATQVRSLPFDPPPFPIFPFVSRRGLIVFARAAVNRASRSVGLRLRGVSFEEFPFF